VVEQRTRNAYVLVNHTIASTIKTQFTPGFWLLSCIEARIWETIAGDRSLAYPKVDSHDS